jgi:hypothetical protein
MSSKNPMLNTLVARVAAIQAATCAPASIVIIGPKRASGS